MIKSFPAAGEWGGRGGGVACVGFALCGVGVAVVSGFFERIVLVSIMQAMQLSS